MSDPIDEFFGRNVSYSKDKQEAYKRLTEDSMSPFKGRNMTDVFVNAAVAGFVSKRRSKLKKKIPNISTVAMTHDQKAILLTIAIAMNESVDILFEKNEVKVIIEEYANSGIDTLEARISGSINDEPIQDMAQRMKESIQDWQTKK